MENISSIFYLVALSILSISVVHILPTYILKSAINSVLAAGTTDERASYQLNKMQGFFSPIGPEFSKQIPKQLRSDANNLFPQHLIQAGSPVQGNLSAPVTIIEFGDFQCGFCDRFAKETEPKINETYIHVGKVNMIFKNFVTHGPDSNTAAIAAQCANDQGKFWNFYDILYKNQGEENSGWASANNLKKALVTSIWIECPEI
jgi:protein-disulfide isomerase